MTARHAAALILLPALVLLAVLCWIERKHRAAVVARLQILHEAAGACPTLPRWCTTQPAASGQQCELCRLPAVYTRLATARRSACASLPLLTFKQYGRTNNNVIQLVGMLELSQRTGRTLLLPAFAQAVTRHFSLAALAREFCIVAHHHGDANSSTLTVPGQLSFELGLYEYARAGECTRQRPPL